jgi:hypothetical protein
MSALKEQISAFDDFQVVRFFEYFGQELLSSAEVSQEQIKAGIPDAIRAITGFAVLESITPDQAKHTLDLETSAPLVARTILLNLADDETLAPLLQEAVDTYSDEELPADIVLALGVAVALVLIAATTEFEAEVWGMKIKKSQANRELVEAIMKGMRALLPTNWV